MTSLLILTTMDYRHEQNQRVHHQARHLAARFGRITVVSLTGALRRTLREVLRLAVCPRVALHWEGDVALLEVTPLWFPRRWTKPLGILRDVYDMLSLAWAARGRYDVCLAVGPFAAAAGCLLRRRGRVGRVVYDDIDYEPGFARTTGQGRFRASLEKRYLRNADAVITTSALLCELRRDVARGPVVHIPNGVDWEAFAPARRKRPHPPTALYAGNVDRYYSGLDVVLEALPDVAFRIPGFRLVILGGGEPAEETILRDRIRTLALEDVVIWLGRQPYAALPAWFAEADLGLAVFPPNPLRRFAWPYKVIEYMAGGLAVLATAGSQAAQIVEAAGAGEAVAFEADAVASALCRLFGPAGDLSGYAQRGIQASRQYQWADLMARVQTVLEGAGSDGDLRSAARASSKIRSPPGSLEMLR